MRQIPEVGQVLVHLDEVTDFGVGKTEVAEHFVQRQPQGQPHGVTHRVADIGHDFLHKPRAVFEAAAVFVGAVVGGGRQEMLENAEAVGAVETDQVEARRLAPLGGIDEPAAQVADILLIQRAGVDGIVGEGADR